MAQNKRVVFLAYTKAAALEAASRVSSDSGVLASTIHSMAFGALQLTRASIVDNKKLVDFGNHAGFPFKGMDENTDEIQEGDEYASVLSFMNNRMITGEEAYDHFGRPGTWPRFQLFAKSYRNWKSAYGYMDFDDMLLRFLGSDIPVTPIDNLYLDEAQDCSPLQWQVFMKIAAQSTNVVIAGDDDQAIYEWNGADPHGMIRFVESNSAKLVTLDQSHRVPKVVHDLAHDVALFNINKRVPKMFNPRKHEGLIIRYGSFDNIDLHKLYKEGGGMVLARDRWHLEEIKRSFNRELIPYSMLGGYSPWTGRIANELRAGGTPEIPMMWKTFFDQADLTLPINLQLSTVHQAKGRESHRVILDLEMPARTLLSLYNDQDAELRVLYVALTRTSDELILCGRNPLL